MTNLSQKILRAQKGETYVKLQFRKEFPDARQMAADALVVFLEKSGPIDPGLKEKMEKAARAYATTYCNGPCGASIKSCREAVGKVIHPHEEWPRNVGTRRVLEKNEAPW